MWHRYLVHCCGLGIGHFDEKLRPGTSTRDLRQLRGQAAQIHATGTQYGHVPEYKQQNKVSNN